MSGTFKQLEIDWPKCEREYYLKEVVFPKGLKIDHAKLAAVMNRIASFHGQPDGCYESVATLMKLCKLSDDQVERSFAALRKLNLLLERDRPEWHKGSFRKIHPRWINFDELKLMVERQTNPAPQAYQPRTGTVGTPHGEATNPARRGDEPRTQMRANNTHVKETPPHNSWHEVEESLDELGVRKFREAARSARQCGCSPEHCLELIEFYRVRLATQQHGWQAPAYVLLRRFESASPSVPVADGWFGTGARPTIAAQRDSSLQKTRELLASLSVPEHERAKPMSAEDRELVANFGKR